MSATTAAGAAARPRGRRRPVPPEIRRRRLLLSVANHSVAIALSIAFLLPFVFIVATSLMTNQQALSPKHLAAPVRVVELPRRCSRRSRSSATP